MFCAYREKLGMLRIISHIENLLLSHDCIVVPGLGGFVTRYEEAFFSEDGSEIFPPYRSVSFNARLKEDDGLLTQSYVTTYDTNYPKAMTLVRNDVSELRKELEHNQEVQIGNIGRLQLTLSHSLLFTPAHECGIFAKDLYGLVQCKIVRAINEVKGVEEVNEVKEVKEVNGQSPKTNAKRSMLNVQSENTHYIIRVSKNAVRYTVTTIAAAMLYFVFTIAPSVSPVVNTNVQEATIVPTKAQEVNGVKEVKEVKEVNEVKGVKEVKEVKGVKEVKEVKGVNENNSQFSILNSQSKKTYTLVLASQVTVKGAQTLAQRLHDDGYTEARVIDDDGMTRVIYSSYPSEEEAYKAARELRSQHKNFKSAWVMEY